METHKVKPAAELSLGHRAFHIRTSCKGHIVAGTNDGTLSVIGPDRTITSSFSIGRKLEALSLHPNGEILATVIEGEVRLLNTRGNILGSKVGPFVDAWFESNAKLWLAERCSDGESFRVEIYEDGGLEQKLADVEIDDPFGDSALLFPDRPMDGQIPAWIAAGQDGQVVSWLELDGDEVIVDTLDDFEQCCPPEVSPSGDEFLIPTGMSELRRYDLLRMDSIGTLTIPNNHLITKALYLDDNEALVCVEEGIVYRVDVQTMRISSTVEVAGHEPRKTSELYPGLDDSDLCTDLFSLLAPGGGMLVSVHSILPDPDFRQLGHFAWWR